MKLNKVAASSTHRVLIYGEPKTGKTELAGTLAKKFNLHFFDLENGYLTLQKLDDESQSRIEYYRVPDSRIYPIGIETMLKVITGAKMTVCHEHGKVNCPMCKAPESFTEICLNSLTPNDVVVIDSLSQLTVSAMSHLTKGKPDDYKPEWEDYRAQGALLDKFLSQVQQAKFNVVCITHVVETELENKQKKLVPLCGTTSFSRNTAKYFDHVIYCQLRNKKHAFGSSTSYDSLALSGSRTDFAIEGTEVPDLVNLFEGKSNSKPNIAVSANARTQQLLAGIKK